MLDLLEHIQLRGIIDCFLIQNGKIVYKEHGENLVVNTGRTLVLNQLFGGITASRPYTSAIAQYIALGSSAVAASPGDTSLGLEATGGANVRKLVTVTSPSTGIYQASALWIETDNPNTTIAELGLFTTSASGGGDIMFSHYILQNSVVKDQYTQFQVNYQIQLSSS